MKYLVSAFLAVACIAPTLAEGPTPVTKQAGVQVSGKLLALDGKMGWSGRLIKVSPVGKNVSLGVLTDREGKFTLPTLQPGTYVISVGALTHSLTVVQGKAVQPIVLLASRDVLEAGAVGIPMGQATGGGGGGTGLIVLGVTTGVVAVAGGVGFAYLYERQRHQDNEHERDNVAQLQERNSLISQLNDLSGQFNTLAGRVGDQDALISTLQNDINTALANNTNLTNQINTLQNTINNLQAQINILQTRINNASPPIP